MGQARGLQLAASPSAATRRASSSTSSPTRWPRAATRSSRSAACSPTTPARSPRSRRALGLGCVLVQESWVDWPDAVYDRVGNIQLVAIMGADVRLVQAGFGIGFKESWEQALRDVEARGGTPYAIPAGASDHRLGGLGFAELGARGRASRSASSACSSTRSSSARSPARTQAGMIAGFAAPGARPGASSASTARRKPAETHEQVARIARGTAALIGVGRELRDDEIVLDDRYHAGTYGIPDDADARGHPARRATGGDAHRPGLRGQVDGRADRPGGARRDRAAARTCCMRTSAASRRSTPTARCSADVAAASRKEAPG